MALGPSGLWDIHVYHLIRKYKAHFMLYLNGGLLWLSDSENWAWNLLTACFSFWPPLITKTEIWQLEFFSPIFLTFFFFLNNYLTRMWINSAEGENITEFLQAPEISKSNKNNKKKNINEGQDTPFVYIFWRVKQANDCFWANCYDLDQWMNYSLHIKLPVQHIVSPQP